MGVQVAVSVQQAPHFLEVDAPTMEIMAKNACHRLPFGRVPKLAEDVPMKQCAGAEFIGAQNGPQQGYEHVTQSRRQCDGRCWRGGWGRWRGKPDRLLTRR